MLERLLCVIFVEFLFSYSFTAYLILYGTIDLCLGGHLVSPLARSKLHLLNHNLRLIFFIYTVSGGAFFTEYPA